MAVDLFSFLYHQLLKEKVPNPTYTARMILEKELCPDATLAELKRGVPLERLLKQVEFFGGVFEINSHVLIPRPETELMVDAIANVLRNDQRKNISFLDLCTGSGCIGISLKNYHRSLQLFASDISQDALDCAKANAALLDVEGDFRLGDLLEPWFGFRFDFIVCNPPYISIEHFHQLDASVRNFDPMIALTDGQDGLSFYRALSKKIKDYLNPGGQFFTEIGYDQGVVVKEIFQGAGLKVVSIGQDYSGRDRWIHVEGDECS